jgi:hypothetical protein
VGWLHHHIFENEDVVPIVSHTFPGKTQDEAFGVLKVHAHYDAFLCAAITTGQFPGAHGSIIRLRTAMSWEP